MERRRAAELLENNQILNQRPAGVKKNAHKCTKVEVSSRDKTRVTGGENEKQRERKEEEEKMAKTKAHKQEKNP